MTKGNSHGSIKSIRDLSLDTLNANKGTPRGLQMVEDSLRKYGAGRSILADKHGRIIAGNKTLQSASDINLPIRVVETDGKELVIVQRTDLDLTDAKARELAIADNRSSQVGLDWDAETLSQLKDEGVKLSAMFTEKELAFLLPVNGKGDAPEPQIDRAAELQEKWRVKPGQIWQIGRHRLMCGDSTEKGDVDTLMDGRKINVAFTSPPYAEQREYDKLSSFRPVPPDQYVEWFEPVAANVADVLSPDGSWFINIKPSSEGLDTSLYVMDLVIAHVRQWGWHFATEFCWERNGVPKSVTQRFKNQFEPVYQFTRGRWKMRPDNVTHHSNNVPRAGGKGSGNTTWKNAQGGHGDMSVSGSFGAAKKRRRGTSEFLSEIQRTARDVAEHIGPGMAYPGNRLPTFASTHQATGHTAAFPVGLASFFIAAFSDSSDSVYDPFVGSGTTICAAESLNRRCYAMEISLRYCSVTLERLTAMGLEAKLVEEGIACAA